MQLIMQTCRCRRSQRQANYGDTSSSYHCRRTYEWNKMNFVNKSSFLFTSSIKHCTTLSTVSSVLRTLFLRKFQTDLLLEIVYAQWSGKSYQSCRMQWTNHLPSCTCKIDHLVNRPMELSQGSFFLSYLLRCYQQHHRGRRSVMVNLTLTDGQGFLQRVNG